MKSNLNLYSCLISFLHRFSALIISTILHVIVIQKDPLSHGAPVFTCPTVAIAIVTRLIVVFLALTRHKHFHWPRYGQYLYLSIEKLFFVSLTYQLNPACFITIWGIKSPQQVYFLRESVQTNMETRVECRR